MTLEDYQAISWLIQAARQYVATEAVSNEDYPPFLDYPSLFGRLKDSVRDLDHLLLEDDRDPEQDSLAVATAQDDALLQQASYVRSLETDYASLKRLYEIRLEVCAKEVKVLKDQLRQEAERLLSGSDGL
jgi:hypothetical protein